MSRPADPVAANTATREVRMVFRFKLLDHDWNWPVTGSDSIIAFRELLRRAEIDPLRGFRVTTSLRVSVYGVPPGAKS